MTFPTFLSSLSPHLFWDVDKSKMTEENENAIRFIIGRTITHGVMKDWKLIVEKYGYDKIEEVSMQMRDLDNVSLAFLCAIFNRKKEEFRCYTFRQSHPSYWEY
jgi:hypothetical protein